MILIKALVPIRRNVTKEEVCRRQKCAKCTRTTRTKDVINLDAVPSRRHENFRREGHLVAIGVRERETGSVSLTPMVTRCPSRRKFSCRLLGTASRFIISLLEHTRRLKMSSLWQIAQGAVTCVQGWDRNIRHVTCMVFAFCPSTYTGCPRDRILETMTLDLAYQSRATDLYNTLDAQCQFNLCQFIGNLW